MRSVRVVQLADQVALHPLTASPAQQEPSRSTEELPAPVIKDQGGIGLDSVESVKKTTIKTRRRVHVRYVFLRKLLCFLFQRAASAPQTSPGTELNVRIALHPLIPPISATALLELSGTETQPNTEADASLVLKII